MSELPKGWDTTTFGNICGTGQYGWTTKASSQGDVKYLRTTDITKGQIEWDSVPYCQEAPVDLDKYQIQENDILISRAGSVGFSVLIDQAPFLTVFASYLIRFVPLKKIEPYYVAYFLRSPEYWKQISEASAGIALANVNAKKLAELSVPLPPLNEQRRIVAKLDRLFARSRCAREELGRVSGLVQRYKQAVLAAAFRGDLTADWRAENLLTPAIRCSSALYDPPTAIDLREYFDLPKSWVWDFVGHLSNVVRGASPRPAGNPKYFGGNIPWITVGYLTADENPYLTIDKISTFLTEEGKKKSRFIEAGTLMLTNSGATLGVPKIITFGGCFNDGSVALLNINHPLKLYLYYFLRFLTSRYRAIHQGAAQPNLNIDIVKSTPVPIPPVEEQKEIVKRVEKLFKAINLIEQEHQKASKLLDRLEKATLSKAFRGELVPQDPNDEPAAVLLERIQAQRQTQPKRKAKSTRKPKAN